MGYFEQERDEDVIQLINFTRLCLTLDIRSRPFVEQLLRHESFIGGDGIPTKYG